MTVPGGNRTHI